MELSWVFWGFIGGGCWGGCCRNYTRLCICLYRDACAKEHKKISEKKQSQFLGKEMQFLWQLSCRIICYEIVPEQICFGWNT